MTQKEFLALIALAVLFGFIVFCLYYIGLTRRCK